MAEKHKSWVLRNKYLEINRVNQEFMAFAQANDIPNLVIRNINLVLDELINNIISYGYSDTEEHYIAVQVFLSNNLLTLVVEDDGIPFDPMTLEQPNTSLPAADRRIGGLGVHLIKSLVDSVKYLRQEGKNILTIEKRISD